MRAIHVLSGDLKGRKFPVGEKTITLGRDNDATIQILDHGVSRHHAEIYQIGELVFIKDLGSTNGCFVNEEKVTEKALHPDDKIRIGTTVLSFEDAAADLKEVEKLAEMELPDEDLTKGRTIEFKLDRKIERETAIKKLGEEVESKSLSVIYDVAKLVGSQKDITHLLKEVLNLAVELTRADSGFIFVLDPKGKLEPKAVHDKEGGEPGSKVSRTIVKRVMQTCRSILSSDAGHDSRFAASASIVMRQIKSVICVPLVYQDKPNGVVYLHSSKMVESFEQPDLEVATAMGIQIGMAIASFNATQRVRRMMASTIKSLVTAMEMRDPKAGGHSERVANYSAHVAIGLKLKPEEVRRVYLAGLLHDVGKIALPPSEKMFVGGYKVKNEHPALGEKILSSIVGLEDIIPAVRHHHEMWDGSGFPDGLKADKIPPIARIVCVANVFDNMCTFGGMGGEGIPVKEVLLDMGERGGKEYDDKVIKALLVCHQKGTLHQPMNVLDEW